MKHREIIIFHSIKIHHRVSNLVDAFMLVHMFYCDAWFWSKFKMNSYCFWNDLKVLWHKRIKNKKKKNLPPSLLAQRPSRPSPHSSPLSHSTGPEHPRLARPNQADAPLSLLCFAATRDPQVRVIPYLEPCLSQTLLLGVLLRAVFAGWHTTHAEAPI